MSDIPPKKEKAYPQFEKNHSRDIHVRQYIERRNYLSELTIPRLNDLSSEVGESLKKVDDINKNYFRLDFSGMGKDDLLGEVSKKLGDVPTYESFVKLFAEKAGLKEKDLVRMLADESLRDLFIEFLESDLYEAVNTEEAERKYRKLSLLFGRSISEYTNDKSFVRSKGFIDDLLLYKRGRRFMKINEKLLSSDSLGDEFYSNRVELDRKLVEGELTEAEYLKEIELLITETVKASGDEELMKMWNSDEFDSKSMTIYQIAVVNDPVLGYGGFPAVSKAETASAEKDVSGALTGTNFNVEFSGEATAVVQIDDFSLDLFIHKDPQTGNFVYFVGDSYSRGQKIGPITSAELSSVVDSRRIDAYLTKRVGKISANAVDSEEISRLPDTAIESLGLKLLGEGKDRGFDIAQQNRRVLDELAKVLIADDSSFTTIYQKVKALNLYFGKRENVVAARAKLLSGKRNNASSLIS